MKQEKKEKKVNSYLRGIKVIALACVIGGVIGGVTGRFALCYCHGELR